MGHTVMKKKKGMVLRGVELPANFPASNPRKFPPSAPTPPPQAVPRRSTCLHLLRVQWGPPRPAPRRIVFVVVATPAVHLP